MRATVHTNLDFHYVTFSIISFIAPKLQQRLSTFTCSIINTYIYIFITTSCSFHELTDGYIHISFITFRWSRLTAIHVIADPRKRSYISQAITATFTCISEII